MSDDASSPSPPCLVLVQARLRDGRLHLTAFFRSHDIYRAWRHVADEYDPPRVFVAEAWVTSSDRLARYVRGVALQRLRRYDDAAKDPAAVGAPLAVVLEIAQKLTR